MTPAHTPTDVPPPRREAGPLRRVLQQWPVICWLLLLWVLLWGSVSPAVLLSGGVVAVLVVLLFPLPQITRRARFQLLWLLALPGHIVADLVTSTVTVAREAVLRGPRVKAAVLEVPLWAESDLKIAATANLASLTPGTLALEIDREGRKLYVHALPARDAREVEVRRQEVVTSERWMVQTLGPASARRELARWRESPEGRPKSRQDRLEAQREEGTR
ncbi:MAG TPA: Na+/H+ antiporter subunit E [Streptomyces sp.]|nr:Na+/H+ antiporter subunit E [Streptomyces sp.]